MSYIDIACVAILVLALLHGLLKGLFRPLITWAFVIAGVAVGFGHPGVAARFAPSAGWRPLMGLVVVVVFTVVGFLVAHLVAPRIYRLIPGMGLLDRLGGAVLSLVLAFVVLFLLLNGLVTVDRTTAPIDGITPVSVAELQQIQQLVASNPAASIALSQPQLQALEGEVSSGSSATPAADIGQLSTVLGVLRNVHIQMMQSKVAPVIFKIGESLPFLGNGQTWPAS
ncbi:MAG: CvpA family protein [Candidatus Dormibacteria bacterium]